MPLASECSSERPAAWDTVRRLVVPDRLLWRPTLASAGVVPRPFAVVEVIIGGLPPDGLLRTWEGMLEARRLRSALVPGALQR